MVPVQAGPESPEPQLSLQVIFTDPERTRCALLAAREFSRGLQAVITLVVAKIVPYPLSLDRPNVSQGFIEQNMLALVPDPEHETRVEVLYCRDRDVAIRQALLPKSVVLIGGRKSWWPGADQKLARKLRHDGHRVVFVEQPLI